MHLETSQKRSYVFRYKTGSTFINSYLVKFGWLRGINVIKLLNPVFRRKLVRFCKGAQNIT